MAKLENKSITLPCTLHEDENTKVVLDTLTTSQIENVFGFEYLEFKPAEKMLVEKTDRSSTQAAMMSRPFHTFTSPGIDITLKLSTIQISIIGEDSQKMNAVRESLDFALKCVYARGVRFIGDQEEGDTGIGIQKFGSPFPLAGVYKQLTINDQSLSDTLKVFNMYLNIGPLHHKLEVIKALLDSAMDQPNSLDVSCALYFSVIESIYLQDKNHTELTYKLCMRVTKKLKRDMTYRDKLKKLYVKRSNVIHGTEKGSVFDENEHEFLRDLATSTVVAYIKAPEDFKYNNLDALLVGSP